MEFNNFTVMPVGNAELSSVDYNTIGEQITGFRLSEFEITSIEHN